MHVSLRKLALSSVLLIQTTSVFSQIVIEPVIIDPNAAVEDRLLKEQLSAIQQLTAQTEGMKQEEAKLLETLIKYVKNMGRYFGYDFKNYCTSGGICNSAEGDNFTNLLVDPAIAYTNQINMISTFLGALLPASPKQGSQPEGTPSFQLVPSTAGNHTNYLNALANQSFTSQQTPFSNPSSTGALSVSAQIDQQPYQSDPVSQSILNILSTPDASFCLNTSTGVYNSPCYTGQNNSIQFGGGPVLSEFQVMLNAIGSFPESGRGYPAPGYFALGASNATLIPQLSSDSLLGPLMFNNSAQSSGGSSENPSANSGKGLTAANQIQQAANFIRYASGAVAPLPLPKYTEYSKLFEQAIADTTKSKTVTPAMKAQAQGTIANYLTNLRVYAAQVSVGVGNLYAMLSQRMPQAAPLSGNAKTQTSQALSEFMMATWRLQSSPPSENNQGTPIWFNQINQASSASVQKEIALLLAEINYQMYLTRVQQERMLLTNSLLLIQTARNNAQQNLSLNNIEINNSNTGSSTGGFYSTFSTGP